VRPRVVISRCLGIEACRWNGVVIQSPEVAMLRPHVDFVDVCPEVEIGLGVPRDPVRIVRAHGVDSLVQPATGRDVTDPMTAFARERLAAIGPVDGFLLKSRSPSCGMKDTKVYPTADPSATLGRTAGFFAREVCRYFDGIPAEDEGRLTNFRIREQYLAAIFTLASFRELREHVEGGTAPRRADAARELTRFHAANKLLLMSQNQAEMRRLGSIAANRDGRDPADVLDAYGAGLARAFAKLPRPTNAANVLEHAMGYFKTQIKPPEKRLFLDLLRDFREGRLPLSAPVAVLRGWIARFGEPYLEAQTFFGPYPEALVTIRDSGLGR
jgi:uncharacterized protein YbgA (DUF1722 family)/uncharacterized protein YbbK (DUF523 family)